MRIINKIHKGKEIGWVEWEPILGKEMPIKWTKEEIANYPHLNKVKAFEFGDGRMILRKEHDELNYTTGQSKKGIKPPVDKQTHYHYYFPENRKLGTYTCNSCQEKKKSKLNCCEKPMDDFFEHGYDGGGCHACYDWQIELMCVKCYIKRNCFSHSCRLEDNGDYVIDDKY